MARGAFGGSAKGAYIIPGDPEGSLIYTITKRPHGIRPATDTMPAVNGVFLSDGERELLHEWIASGAPWPPGEGGRLTPIDIRPDEA
jgi:hypothetical protein